MSIILIAGKTGSYCLVDTRSPALFIALFYPKLCALNIGWHENPKRRIDSYITPKGCITKSGMNNHFGVIKVQTVVLFFRVNFSKMYLTTLAVFNVATPYQLTKLRSMMSPQFWLLL